MGAAFALQSLETMVCLMRAFSVPWGVIFVATCVVPAFALVAAAPDPPASAPAVVAIDIQAGLLTLEAHAAPLVEVIKAIGERAGFETIVSGPVMREVSSSFNRVPVPKALARLLVGIDYVLLYAPEGDETAPREVSQLWLLGMSADPANETLAAAELAARFESRKDLGANARSEHLLRLTREGDSTQVPSALAESANTKPPSLPCGGYQDLVFFPRFRRRPRISFLLRRAGHAKT